MNTYVTGATIKMLREKRNLIQGTLAAQIGVSSKTISKWETATGYLYYDCNQHGLFRRKV